MPMAGYVRCPRDEYAYLGCETLAESIVAEEALRPSEIPQAAVSLPRPYRHAQDPRGLIIPSAVRCWYGRRKKPKSW